MERLRFPEFYFVTLISAGGCVVRRRVWDEQFTMEQAEPEFEDVEGDAIARETARWRETASTQGKRWLCVPHHVERPLDVWKR